MSAVKELFQKLERAFPGQQVPEADHIASEIDMLIAESEEKTNEQTLTKLAKMIENTLVDLIRIPFIRDNNVLQTFFELESQDKPLQRSLTLSPNLSAKQTQQKFTMGN